MAFACNVIEFFFAVVGAGICLGILIGIPVLIVRVVLLTTRS